MIVIIIIFVVIIFVVLKLFRVVSGEGGEGGGCCGDSCCCGWGRSDSGQELSGQAWCAKEHCWMIKNSRRAMQILVDCFFFHFLFRGNYRGKRDRGKSLRWRMTVWSVLLQFIVVVPVELRATKVHEDIGLF